VPDTADTVLTLTGTNLAGVSGTISVVADDGAGGRATNSFTATTFADTNNDQPFLYPTLTTNLVAPVNTRLTNTFSAFELGTNAYYWFWASGPNASNSFSSVVNGQLQMVFVPNTNYVGPISFTAFVSSNPNWLLYTQFLPPSLWPPYDSQNYTFAFGDTVISALGTNFVVNALTPFANQLLATFTNGVPNSPTNNFTAFINWGDNSTNGGIISTGSNGQKEVLGSHTYTNAGDYPIYLTILSTVGASATVVATASVPPSLSLAGNVIRWPAWATDYQLQSNPGLSPANWLAVSNFSTLVGYLSVITNNNLGGNSFFRLMK